MNLHWYVDAPIPNTPVPLTAHALMPLADHVPYHMPDASIVYSPTLFQSTSIDCDEPVPTLVDASKPKAIHTTMQKQGMKEGVLFSPGLAHPDPISLA